MLGVAAIIAVACTDQSANLETNNTSTGSLITHLGNIYIAPQTSNAEMITSIDSAADGFFFHASEGNVNCETIGVITGEGAIHTVYEGDITEGDEVRAPLPAEVTDIKRIRFVCSTDDSLRAKLNIALETST